MGGLPVGYLKGRRKRGMNKTDKTRRKNTVLLNNSELTGSALFFFFFFLACDRSPDPSPLLCAMYPLNVFLSLV